MAKKGNNEGSIYKDKTGKWRGAVTLYTADGKPKRKYFYGKTKREVTEKVNKVLNELRTNTYIEPSKVTLYQWLCTWLETYCYDLRPTTSINYETYIHRHIQSTIGNVKLCDLNVLILQQFYNDRLRNGNLKSKGKNLSAKTLRNMHNMLHKALEQAVALEMIAKNPADYVTVPKLVKKERKFFTVEEQQQLQERMKGEKLEMAVLLDLYTGMRMGELLGLLWKNVHIDLNGSSYIKVTQTLNRIKKATPVDGESKTYLAIGKPKTANSIRKIPLLPEIAQALYDYRIRQEHYLKEKGLPKSDYVFINQNGGWIEPRDFQRDFKKLLKRHNIREINVHGLRHTFATRALESGMSIKTLSKILGHANSGFTMDTYAHVTDDLMTDEMTNLQGFLD